jgi:hypothetical protein
MTKKYNIDESMGYSVIWYEENGTRVSFTLDESNPYYQEYLASLEATEPEEE